MATELGERLVLEAFKQLLLEGLAEALNQSSEGGSDESARVIILICILLSASHTDHRHGKNKTFL